MKRSPFCRWTAFTLWAVLLSFLLPRAAAAANTIVTLGFDDSTTNQMTAVTMLNQRGLKGVFYVISGLIGNPGGGSFYMTRANLDTIAASGHEIAGHTLTHPDLTTLTSAQVQHEVCDGKAQLQSWGFNPTTFAYPYGAHNASVESITKGCYASARMVGDVGCPGCATAETIPPVDMWAIRSPDSLKSNTSLAAIEKYVTDAENNGGGWVHLVIHQICENCDTYSISSGTLSNFLNWLQPRSSIGTVVRTNAQVLGAAAPPPVISGLSPSSAAAGAPGFTMTVNGSNFVSGASVMWNGANRSTTFFGAGQLHAAIPSSDIAAAGSADVSVMNPDGGLSGTQALAITGAPTPVLSSVSPSSAPVGTPGLTVGVFGSGFVSSSTVRWNGSSRSTIFVNGGQLNAQLASGDLAAAATAAMTVFTSSPGGGTSASAAFLVYTPNPVPTLASIAPSSATAGSPGFALSVFGGGYVSSSTVRWNGAARTTVFISTTQLSAQITAADLSAATTTAVTVFSPGPGGGASGAQAFTVVPTPPGVPAIASISPSSAAVGAPGMTMNVFGSGYISSSTVRWNGADRATVFVSSTQLNAQVLTGDLTAAATADVTVFTPAPGGGTSAPATFLVYVPNPVPSLASLSPSSATAGSPGFALSVFGDGFVSSSTVRWKGTVRSTVFVSSGQLTAQITTADLSAATTAPVTVFSPGPGGGASGAQIFTVAPPPPGTPVIASVSPSSAAVGTPGLTIGVFGFGFVSTSTVRWNGTDRVTVFVSSTHLSAQVLANDLAAETTAAVTVFTPAPGGGTSATATFLVYTPNPVPTLTSLSPSNATAGSPGFALSVFGDSFVSSSTVRWNGASRATVFISSGQLTAQITAPDVSSAGTANVTVFNPGPGGGTSSPAGFVVAAPPPPTGALFTDSFNVSNRLITNDFAHFNPANPAAVISSTWDVTSGSLFADAQAGWTGVPDAASPNATSSNGTGSAGFQALTKRADFGDVSLFLSLTNQGFVTTPSTPASAWDGANVVLRWQSANVYYFMNFNRRDNTAVLKKKLAAAETTLASIAFPVPLNTVQKVQADIQTQPGGSVALKLTVNGAALLSFTDAGTGGAPITGTGAVGLFGDNDNLRFDDFTVMPFGVSPSTGPQPNPIPVLASISPSSAAAGSPGMMLSVFGSGFVNGSTARWNGADRATVFVSGAQLNAQVLTGDLSAAATAAVTVFTPAPGGGISSPATFLVYTPNPVPSLTSLSPSSATAGSPGFALTVFGGGFVSSSTVRWNGGVRATVFVSSSQLTAQLTAADVASPGSSVVTVFSLGPGGGASGALNFSVNPGPPGAPILASVFPSSAAVGTPGLTINVFGSAFFSSSTVRWNGADRTTVFVSSAQLNAQVLTGDLAAAATAAVTVFTPAPGGGTSSPVTFLVSTPNPAPSLTSLSPSSATAGSAGLSLNVFGGNFVTSSTVRWNGAARATVFVSTAQLTAQITTADLTAATTANVTVFSPGPGGGVSAGADFVVSPGAAPTVLFGDDFNRPNALITNEYAFYNASDPASRISSTWTVDSGSLFIDNNAAWTGVPDAADPNAASSNGTDSAVFRARTKRGDFGDVAVSFTLINQGFVATPSTPAQAWDGVQLALRYTSENSYYEFSFNRRDGTAVIKKKLGATFTTLASASYAAPINSPQALRGSARSNSDGSVTLILSVGGNPLISVADAGAGGAPILGTGAIGFRGDNTNFRFDDLAVRSSAGTGTAAIIAGPTAPSAAAANLDAVRLFPNPWRVDRHSGVPVTIDGLTAGSEVRIFTIAGRPVRTISAPSGVGTWDLSNGSGERVASGLYLYLITGGGDSGRKRGVLTVIR
jgi:hypothetical protein